MAGCRSGDVVTHALGTRINFDSSEQLVSRWPLAPLRWTQARGNVSSVLRCSGGGRVGSSVRCPSYWSVHCTLHAQLRDLTLVVCCVFLKNVVFLSQAA